MLWRLIEYDAVSMEANVFLGKAKLGIHFAVHGQSGCTGRDVVAT
jgi:hypothetical protein